MFLHFPDKIKQSAAQVLLATQRVMHTLVLLYGPELNRLLFVIRSEQKSRLRDAGLIQQAHN